MPSSPEQSHAPSGIQTAWHTLSVDGSPMALYMAQPANAGPRPAVLVWMEIFGVNAHIQAVAHRLAQAGYVALAPNYYHRTTPNLTLGYTDADIATGRTHKDQTTRAQLIADIQAVQYWCSHQPEHIAHPDRIGCIGFCFGGHVAYIAAGQPGVVATASFYGGGIANGSPGPHDLPTLSGTSDIHGQLLCLFGGQDPLIPQAETVRIETALQTAGVRHEVIRYPQAGHGFFCDQRGDFNPEAATDAWQRVLALFEQSLNSQL